MTHGKVWNLNLNSLLRFIGPNNLMCWQNYYRRRQVGEAAQNERSYIHENAARVENGVLHDDTVVVVDVTK